MAKTRMHMVSANMTKRSSIEQRNENRIIRSVSFDNDVSSPSKKRKHINITGHHSEIENSSMTETQSNKIRTMLEERVKSRLQKDLNHDDPIHRQTEVVVTMLHRQIMESDTQLLTLTSKEIIDVEEVNKELNRHLIRLLGRIVQHREKERMQKRQKILEINSSQQSKYYEDDNSRGVMLQNILGMHLHRRALNIVQTIHKMGMELTGDCSLCTFERCTIPKKRNILLGDCPMPSPVRKLFCDTSLRQVLNDTPISQLNVSLVDTLCNQAERNLSEYLTWLAKNRSK